MPDSVGGSHHGAIRIDEVDESVDKRDLMSPRSGAALSQVVGPSLDKVARAACLTEHKREGCLILDPGLVVVNQCSGLDKQILEVLRGGAQRELGDLSLQLSHGQNEVSHLLEQEQGEYDLAQSPVHSTYEDWLNCPLISENVRASLQPPFQDWSRVSGEQLKQLEETLSSMKKVTEIEVRGCLTQQNARMQILLMCMKAFVEMTKRSIDHKSRIIRQVGG